MAPRSAAVLIILLAVAVVPLAAVAGNNNLQILSTINDQPAGGESTVVADAAPALSRPREGGGEGDGEGGGAVAGGGAQPMSDCMEKTLYRGPCLEMLCTAACILELNSGGHCRGGFLLFKKCNCFLCL